MLCVTGLSEQLNTYSAARVVFGKDILHVKELSVGDTRKPLVSVSGLRSFETDSTRTIQVPKGVKCNFPNFSIRAFVRGAALNEIKHLK